LATPETSVAPAPSPRLHPRTDWSERQLLGTCPACAGGVPPNAYSVRYRGDWYHLRCALEHNAQKSRGGRVTR
jgi:hypothetical protein